MPEEVYRYRAFISYRHVERDRKWARWLIEKLETYRTPRALVLNGAPQRIGHLFRDDDEIPASSDLTNQIEDALRASQFLIVVCSRATPESRWVQNEIDFFRALGHGNRILVLLVEGEPGEAFPPNLLRMLQQRILPDGTQTTAWVDAEPIAADVRSRSDEQRSVTKRRAFLRLAAGLLGVSFDDLAQREHQRRVRKQRVWGAMAGIGLIAFAAGGYTYWNDYIVHTHYYANYGTRWGVPFGIGALSAATAAQRNVSYAINTLHGQVIEMRRENGSHGLMPLAGDGIHGQAWDAGVAEWRLTYKAARVAEVDLDGKTGRRLRIEQYFWQRDGSAIVKLTSPTGSTEALASGMSGLNLLNASTSIPQRSVIAQYKARFTATGLLAKRFYQTTYDLPARDAGGSFGRSYAYNAKGQMTILRNLDMNGAVLVGKSGIAEVRRFYSGTGDLVAVEWRGGAGQLLANRDGYATVRWKRNAIGNAVETDYFGTDGKPILRKDWGVARWTARYGRRGNLVEQDYFGTDGQPILRKDWGVARLIDHYGPRGNPVEENYFGTDGQPILRKDWGVARVTARYGLRGNMVEEDYFGTDGQSILSKDWGVARWTARYGPRGNPMELDFFGTDGQPILRKDWGVARVTARYSLRGNEVEQDYFGTDGKPILRKDWGVARWTARYGPRGNPVEVNYFGTDVKQMILRKDWGVARVTTSYDKRGNIAEEDYFGTDGKPILRKDLGVARVTFRYGPRGNRVEEDYFGTDGQPILSKNQGVARLIDRYGERGNMVEQDFFGTDGQPILRKNWGVARWTARYGKRGNLVEQDYFGTNGKPILSKNQGVARMTTRYGKRGNLVEQDYFGTDGKPIGQGVARVTARYDERGNLVEFKKYGINGVLLDDEVVDTKGTFVKESRQAITHR